MTPSAINLTTAIMRTSKDAIVLSLEINERYGQKQIRHDAAKVTLDISGAAIAQVNHPR